MKIPSGWFHALHPMIQALLIVCCCGLIVVMLINHDAATNLMSILTLAICFLSKIPKDIETQDRKGE